MGRASSAAEFLGAQTDGDGVTTFELTERMHGAFGGVFGGAVAAASVFAARPAANGRRPLSLHTTFVRGLSTPTCHAVVEVVNGGRTLTTVSVDLVDGAGRLAARSTAMFVAGDALSPQSHPGRVTPPPAKETGTGRTTLRIRAPIVDIMEPTLDGDSLGGHVHTVRIPWDLDPAGAAEAACMAADFCVGVPVATALTEPAPMPNPDISLRFLGDETGDELVAVGRLARIDRGLVGTNIEVWTTDGVPVAMGLSSAVLLGG